MRISEVIKILEEIGDTVGDIECKVEARECIEELRDVFLHYTRDRLKSVIFSKDNEQYRNKYKRPKMTTSKLGFVKRAKSSN